MKNRKTFTNPAQQKSKSTKQKQIKERDKTEKEWIRELTSGYTPKNN
jgi:hypothetical protein